MRAEVIKSIAVDGWQKARLDDPDVAAIIMGQSPDSSTYNKAGIGLPFFQGKVDFGLRHPAPNTWCSSPLRVAEPGDVLISVRAPVGDANIALEKCCIGRGLTALRPGPKADTEFLFYSLVHHKPDLDGLGSGAIFKAINKHTLESFEIELPPLPEQRAIAAVLSKIQNAVEVQEKIVTTLKELKAATMAKLFREGLRGEPLKQTEIGKIPESWEVVQVGDIFTVQLGKMLSPKARRGFNPKPYLRNKNLQWGRFDLGEVFLMDFSKDEFEKFSLKPGDVLVCEGGEPGRTAVWHGEIVDCCYQKALHRLRPNGRKNVLPQFYVYWATAAFTVLHTYKPTGTKTTSAHLPKEKLEVMEMALPDPTEQAQIVKILNIVDRRLLLAEKKLATLKSSFSSVLHLLMTGQVRVNALTRPEAS